MIRVLHIVMGMNRGGLETFIMNVYRNIDRSKIQFDFLTHTEKKCDYDDEILSLGGRIYSISPRSKGILKNIRELINFFRRHTEYKIIHQHVSSLTYIEPIKVAKRFNVPIRIIHGHSTNQGGHKIHKFLHFSNQVLIENNATHYFACSEDALKWMFGTKKQINNNYRIVNNGIDSDDFLYDLDLRNLVRKKHDLSDKFVIGHIGRFAYPKNHKFIIEIFAEIKKIEERAVLLLIGDGKLKDNIANDVKMRGLTESVMFTGVISDTASMLNAMDVFLFPSLYEGLGIAVIEAQAVGLQCFISTNIPSEVVITSNVKRISLKESALYWAQEILKYKDGYKRKSESRQIKINQYDINEVSEWLEKFYIDLIS